MSTQRNGKIARLPKSIRDQLGTQIEDGWSGQKSVAWLNEQQNVKSVLKEYFHGRDITEQNLSEWKAGGHQEWLRRQEAVDLVRSLKEHARDLEEGTDQESISDRLDILLTEQFAQLAYVRVVAEPDLEKRWQQLCALSQQLALLRRAEHQTRVFKAQTGANRPPMGSPSGGRGGAARTKTAGNETRPVGGAQGKG